MQNFASQSLRAVADLDRQTDLESSLPDRIGNPAQQKAIAHGAGPMMVLAGPGSGKTFVLTRRISQLIRAHHVRPSEILVITFTRAAAAEMQKRFLTLCEGTHPPVTFGTFHAVFYSILKETSVCRSGSILSEQEKKKILGDVIRKNRYDVGIHGDMLEEILSAISHCKNRAVPADSTDGTIPSAPESMPPELFARIYRDYTEAQDILGKVDFDDMALKCEALFRERPDLLRHYQARYRYLLIDEFQDIAPLQYRLVRQLSAPENNLFIVGDDDQSIYGFRGAKPDIMKNFSVDYPNAAVVTLQVNYRSTPQIVDAAKRLIAHNKNRFPKDSRAQREPGAPIRIEGYESGESMEKALIARLQREKEEGGLAQCAVIARTSGRFPAFAEKCRQAGIPCHFREKVKSIYDSETAKDLAAYLEFSQTPEKERSRRQFLRLMNRPLRYLSREAVDEHVDFRRMMRYYQGRPAMQETVLRLQADLDRIRTMPAFLAVNYIRKAMGYDNYLRENARGKENDAALEEADLLQDSARGCRTFAQWREVMEKRKDEEAAGNGEKRQEPGVTLITMHGSKGLEYDRVFMVHCNEDVTPHKKARSEAELEEERRMFYVGMTRAKKELTLFYTAGEKETADRESTGTKPVLPSRFLKELQ